MKITFLIPNLSAGGAERVLTRIANYWSEQTHEVSVITLDHPQHLPFYPLRPQVKLTQLNLTLQDQKGLKKLTRLWKQLTKVRGQVVLEKPDVLIAFLDIAIFLSLTSTRFLPTKVIVSERNNPYRNTTNPWLQRMNNHLYGIANRIVLQTHRIAQTFPISLQPKIEVIGNPVESPQGQVEDYSAQHRRQVVIAVGRLTPQKGFDVLIGAFARLVQKHPAWQLRIAGVGEEQAALTQLSTDLAIADHVTFLGRIKDVETELLRASFFVLSSRFEGFPNALCEAMAVGLPVVATRCKFGPEEIVRHEENGLLVPVSDAPALSSALHRLADDVALGERLGTQAKKILDQCGVEVVMNQWEALIHEVTGPP